jgi:negative regulator of replication initiation
VKERKGKESNSAQTTTHSKQIKNREKKMQKLIKQLMKQLMKELIEQKRNKWKKRVHRIWILNIVLIRLNVNSFVIAFRTSINPNVNEMMD